MTTRVSAAADTGLPSDRRTLLTGAALASLVAATAAVPAVAAEQPGPIEAAYAVWARAARANDEACLVTSEAEERYEEPDPPLWNPAGTEGGYKIVRLADGRRQACLSDSVENIAELRSIIAAPFEFDPTFLVTEQLHGYRVERAKKTLAAIEAWQAERQRRADACGLTAARELERPLMEAERNARAAIFAMTPATFRETAFFAAVLGEDYDDVAIGDLIEALIKLAGIPSYHLMEA